MNHTEETRVSGVGRGYANYALVLLTVVNLVNYLERNAIFALRTINRFSKRLPEDGRRDIAARRFLLQQKIAAFK